MRVLGLEGTAWCASAALYDTGTGTDGSTHADSSTDDNTHAGTTEIVSDPYEPESGGIHPREAAEHMAEALPAVIDQVLTSAAATSAAGEEAAPIDAVAFSRGPGLGPCLRTVGTAARSLAGALDVPLVGVNHMLAHLEIGRHESGFDDPVCLNASGANAHLLGYQNGRYRVLGETMDAGVGNAIDKFTRHVGWSHPGGPKVEAAAADAAADAAGSPPLLELPYVVKGMDFSFSGISSAANDAYDDGESVEAICFALQEHVFAMLTEVTERALSLTGADELVVGGGVGQNRRLQSMLESMCRARGATCYVPDARYLRDNAGMIAVLGAKMYAAGQTIPIAESTVDPNFRPDQVAATWREGTSAVAGGGSNQSDARTDADKRGAEAVVRIGGLCEDERDTLAGDRVSVKKRRLAKSYRHPALDRSLRRDRTVMEARTTSEARRAGVATPLVADVDVPKATLTLQHVGLCDLATMLTDEAVANDAACSPEEAVAAVGTSLGRLHEAGIVHGDPTTRNVRVGADSMACENTPVYLIDFGLGYYSGHIEDHAMDLHVFEGAVTGTVADPDPLIDAFEASYRDVGNSAVLDRLRSVQGRGRYR